MQLNKIYSRDIEKSMSHIDFIFSNVDEVEKGTQGGLYNSTGEILISVIRRGCFVFDIENRLSTIYLAEKLNIDMNEAQEIINVIEKQNECK